MRNWTRAVGMIALVVALAGCGGQSEKAAATATIATQTAPATATPSGPGVWTTLTGCPATIPARLRVLYQADIQQQKSAPTIVTLKRSDDCGATWTNLTPPAIPGVSYTTDVSLMTIFASPLNANTAYLTLQMLQINGTQTCPSTSSATTASRSTTICQPQFVTTDGGATWQALRLPVPGILGVLSATSPITDLMIEGMLRAQGSLLYGVVTDWDIGANSATPPGRLVVSSDGGVHWSSADSALAAQGYSVWDFAVTSTSSVVYVTAEPFNDPSRQAPTYSPTLSIWSSPNGGQTWTKSSPTPGSGTESGQGGEVMFMSAGMSGGKSIVYIVANNEGQARMLASVDGGHSWQEDTQLKYADTGGEIFGLLGTLSDGSVVIEQPAGGGPTLAWKPGSAQRTIAQNAKLMSYFTPIFQQRADGLYLWLTGYAGASEQLSIAYTKLQL